MTSRIIVGSNAFFKDYEDFKPTDTDILIIEDEPTKYEFCSQIRLLKPEPKCMFYWKRLSKDEFIKYALESSSGMVIGKFLVPEFASEIGLIIDDLHKLEPLIDRLDEKHNYEKKIYNYYIENGEFSLSKEQLDDVYSEYKKYKETEA